VVGGQVHENETSSVGLNEQVEEQPKQDQMLSKEFLLNQSIQECLQSMTNEGINISQSINFCISKVLTAQQPDDHSNSTDHYALSHYHLSNYFEIAVEFIDSIAGLIVLFSVGLACLNLIIVGVNIILGKYCLC
jgi:hypothetical protein